MCYLLSLLISLASLVLAVDMALEPRRRKQEYEKAMKELDEIFSGKWKNDWKI